MKEEKQKRGDVNIKQEVLSDYHFRLSLSNIVAIYDGDGSRVCVALCAVIFFKDQTIYYLYARLKFVHPSTLTTTTTTNSKKCN